MVKMLLNKELNGVELYFDDKPAEAILNNLKGNSFRWSGFKKCWYAKQNEKTLKLAEELTNDKPITAGVETISTETVKKQNKSLWKLTRIPEKFEVNKNLRTKEIAKEIRQHIKTRFLFCKFSVTSDSSIYIHIVSSPFEKDSKYLKAIQEYCTEFATNYKYCTSYDPYGDYGSSYNFYGGRCETHWEYKQTEQTEAIKADILDFDQKQAEFEQQEEARKEKEYQERIKQQEEDNKLYAIKAEEEKKEIETINNSVNIITLEETDQYFVIKAQMANMNKNNTLEEYREEIAKNDFYLNNVKITKEIHFQNEESLNYFSNMLLNDFDFLSGTGGSFTDDIRVNSMTDYNNMEKEERETVIFNLYGVAIYYSNQLQFVIDTQGYSYSRYVGLVDGVKIQKDLNIKQFINPAQLQELKQKAETLEDYSVTVITDNNLVNTWDNENWIEYKGLMKEQLKANNFKLSKAIIQQLPEESEKLKVAMYKLLVEVDSIQEQFKNTDLTQGQKLTLFYIGDFGSMITSRIIFDSVEYKKYAQYDNAVKLTFKPENKRKLYYNHFYSQILVYNGWLELPEEVLHTLEKTGSGMTITRTKYLSCDKRQYDDILNHFAADGIKPIINTYKPTF